MTETEEQEAIDNMPKGFFRIDEGLIKEGDMIWGFAGFETRSWHAAMESYVGESTGAFNMVCRPMECYPDRPLRDQIKDHLKAKTDDEGKPAIAHLPYAALEGMARVQAYGAKKYGDFYNFKKGLEACRNLSCALRHIYKWIGGESNDEESGESHLFHAMVRISFVVQNEKDGTMIDDRYSKEEV